MEIPTQKNIQKIPKSPSRLFLNSPRHLKAAASAKDCKTRARRRFSASLSGEVSPSKAASPGMNMEFTLWKINLDPENKPLIFQPLSAGVYVNLLEKKI
jgi:hypothetical protein